MESFIDESIDLIDSLTRPLNIDMLNHSETPKKTIVIN